MTLKTSQTKLKVGMEFPSYKALCEYLGEEEKNNNSKKAQVREWNRFFTYENNRSKGRFTLVITNVFKEEQPIPPKKDNIYVGLLEIVLMNKLSLESGCSINMTKRNLYEYVGFTNNNFTNKNNSKCTFENFVNNHKEDNLIKSKKHGLFYYNDFSMFVNTKLDRLLFDSLNSMQKRHLIFYNKEYLIEYDEELDDNTVEHIKRPATKDEVSEILELTSNFKGMHPEFKFVNPYNYDAYYAGLNDYIYEKKGWDKTFMTISVVINKKYIRSGIPEAKAKIADICKESKLKLNLVTIDKFNEYFENRYNNNRKKAVELIKQSVPFAPSDWTDDDYIDNYKDQFSDLTVYEYEYLPLQRELIQLFINLENETYGNDGSDMSVD